MRLKNVAAIPMLVTAMITVTGCSGSGGDSGGGGTTATADINGKVSGGASASSSSFSFLGKALSALGLSAQSTDGCVSGTFSGAYVGGGGTAVVAGSFSGGEFTVPAIAQKKELILTFTCEDGSSQRCLAKSGDAGIYCNSVADAVMGAFETALGKSVTDTSFNGKSIAKVGAAIVQAAQNDSTSTTAFNTAITTCKALTSGKEACYQNAITSSTFAGAFKLMQTMANGWTVDSLFTLMVDVYGARLSVDTFIYSGFATKMDEWLTTDFVAETRNYLSAVVADQLAGGSTYVTQLECQMSYSKYQSGGMLKYSPKMVNNSDGISVPTCSNTEFFQKNGFNSSAITAINTAITNESHSNIDVGGASVGCSGSNLWNNPNYYCVWPPELVIASKFSESNRNDPLGEHGGDFYNQPRVSMINIFQEVQDAIQGASASDPASCLSGGSDGPPVIAQTTQCQNWFGSIMAAQKQNFAGLLGLYLYLKSPNSSGLLSLAQIHKLFVGSSFLNNRLTLTGNNSCGAQVSGSNNYLPALASYSNGIVTAQSGFGCSSGGSNTISSSAATAAAALAAIPYDLDFKMFEQIPSAEEIRSYVFGSAYHSDWNPTGQKLFWAAQVQNTGLPVLCKMTNTSTGSPKESALDGQTTISCMTSAQLTAAGVTAPNANGVMTLPSDYPYTLQNYGYQGDGKGSVFALADAKTGMQVRPGGNPVLVYQINTGNGTGQCNSVSDAGTIKTAYLNFGWGDSTSSQAASVYCMDFTNFAQSSQYMLYNGGSVSIRQVNGDGTSWTWEAQQVGSSNPTSTTSKTLLPVCYFAAASGGLTVSSTTGLTTGVSSTGEITSTTMSTTDHIDLCSSTSYSSATKYYIIMAGGSWQESTRSDLKASLIGTSSGAQVLRWRDWGASGVTDWESMQVFVSPATLENELNESLSVSGISAGCTSGNASTCVAVAPVAAQAPVMSLQLANQRWNAKFDPYCDDRNGNGYCDCTAGTTGNAKDAASCTLEDAAAEPTMSQPPYWTGASNAAAYAALFAAKGGKAGAELSTYNGSNFNGQYLNTQSLWMDMNSVFQCQYLAGSETTYRTPTQLEWNDFGSLHHGGCPASAGGTVQTVTCSGSCTGGGPVRMVNPVAAKNAYAVNRPNGLIKLINYATKSVGQGISVGENDAVFTFDEALALVALRGVMPVTDINVHQAGTTSATNSTVIPGALPSFQPVRLGNNDHGDMDIASAVLRAITHPSEVTGE